MTDFGPTKTAKRQPWNAYGSDGETILAQNMYLTMGGQWFDGGHYGLENRNYSSSKSQYAKSVWYITIMVFALNDYGLFFGILALVRNGIGDQKGKSIFGLVLMEIILHNDLFTFHMKLFILF